MTTKAVYIYNEYDGLYGYYIKQSVFNSEIQKLKSKLNQSEEMKAKEDLNRHFVRTRRLQVQGEFVYMFSALTGRTKCKQSRLALATCKDGQNACLKQKIF